MHHPNPELGSKLAQLLADTVATRFIFQGYHWNVLGPDFGEYHEFFGMLYEDVESSIDPLAENILKVGYPAPYLLQDYLELSYIKEERHDGSSVQFMLQSALRVNDTMISCLHEAGEIAEKCREFGLMDFLAQREDMHKKWRWQIKAFLGVR
jgi:starvation-inducible DNA-binding protein